LPADSPVKDLLPSFRKSLGFSLHRDIIAEEVPFNRRLAVKGAHKTESG
jgi:hypothetical protein